MIDNPWAVPPPDLTLAADTAYVWRVALQGAEADWSENVSLLSLDERERADRFRRPRDSQQFAHTRATLRRLLGRLCHTSPASLRFGYGAQGKPTLLSDASLVPLSFNVSHSGDYALIAVCMESSVGVDIERVRHDFSGEDIARRFFCDNEIAWLHHQLEELRADAFFRLWTRKEAFLKARGEGIWHDLARFDVSASPSAPVRDEGQPAPWLLHDLFPADGYCAALAVSTAVTAVITWEWTP